MKPYYAVVAASKGYQPGLAAFLNSFRIHHKGMGIKIIVCDYDLEPAFVEKYSGDDLEWVKVTSQYGNIWATKIERFRVASELSGAVVGVYDADMYICNSMINFWKIAEAGMIAGGSNGSNIGFGSNWNESYKMEVPNAVNTKTLTSVPTFMDIDKHGDIWRSIYEHKRDTNAGGDFPLLNIFILKLDRLDQVVAFPSEVCTGVHHFQVKNETRVISKSGGLFTNTGLLVASVHGRYWSGDWYANLMKPLPKHCARMGVRNKNSKAYQGALQSRQLLMDEFNKYCDWPYESTVKEATLANIKEQEDMFFTNTATMEQENAKLLKEHEGLRNEIIKLKKQLEQ